MSDSTSSTEEKEEEETEDDEEEHVNGEDRDRNGDPQLIEVQEGDVRLLEEYVEKYIEDNLDRPDDDKSEPDYVGIGLTVFQILLIVIGMILLIFGAAVIYFQVPGNWLWIPPLGAAFMAMGGLMSAARELSDRLTRMR